MPVANSTNQYYLIGGTVRKLDSVWAVVDNGTHWNRGIDPPVETEDHMGLCVPIRPVSDDCGWGAVTVDGMLNQCGITIGISANGHELNLTAAKNGIRIPFDDPAFDDPGANIWISWVQIKP
jgi:hypothetical protein